MSGQRTTRDRFELTEHRLRKVLKANTVCSGRTLENKISDAGPTPMRIDPHVLTKARRGLEETGEIVPLKLDGMRWLSRDNQGDSGPSIRMREQL